MVVSDFSKGYGIGMAMMFIIWVLVDTIDRKWRG